MQNKESLKQENAKPLGYAVVTIICTSKIRFYIIDLFLYYVGTVLTNYMCIFEKEITKILYL